MLWIKCGIVKMMICYMHMCVFAKTIIAIYSSKLAYVFPIFGQSLWLPDYKKG